MKQIAVIVNPVAGNGSGKRVWQVLQPGLHALFSQISHRLTNSTDDIAGLTRDLLRDKPDYLLIIGGDGTLGQSINGLISDDQLLSPSTRVAYYNCGYGGDFARQFPPQKVTEFLDRLIHNQHIITNIGKVSFSDRKIKYFINIASCGVSAQVVMASTKKLWLKRFGGGLYYFVLAFWALLRSRPTEVQIQFDNQPSMPCFMLMAALCNGQYFGRKMHVAPMSKVDDDLLDAMVFLDFNRINALIKFLTIYSGKHLLEKKVHYRQAKTIVIESKKQNIPVETDGEWAGYLPARFELIPLRLELII